jgi:O-methyltransferase involved in polyketide biosynthesis
MNNLKGVADTLYLPLAARIYVSKRFPDFFYDGMSLSLEGKLPDNGIEKKSDEYTFMASVCRYHVTDQIVKDFIERSGTCNVVNLGAGLETMFHRLSDDRALFYEIDLPEVIKTRKELLPKNKNEILIGQDMFDMEWTMKIDASVPTIITALGVFQYFEKEKLIALIQNLKQRFKDAELVFDAMNSKAIGFANRYVEKTGNREAHMPFYLDDPEEFASEAGIRMIEEKKFFTDARKLLKNKLNLYTRIAMRVVDQGSRRGYILCYKL